MNEPVNLVALRDARQRAVDVLSQRFAEDLINQQELERRLDAVSAAATLADVERLTADLVEPVRTGALAGLPTPAPPALMTILSHQQRDGAWNLPAHMKTLTVMGGTVLDLRQVALGMGDHDVAVRVVMGNMTVVVPDGVAVEVTCQPVLASVEVDRGVLHQNGSAGVGARIRISGWVVMGSLEVVGNQSPLVRHLQSGAASKQLEPPARRDG